MTHDLPLSPDTSGSPEIEARDVKLDMPKLLKPSFSPNPGAGKRPTDDRSNQAL